MNLILDFELWGLRYRLFQTLAALIAGPLEILDERLDDYGQQLYHTGRPLNDLRELLNGVAALYPLIRGRLPVPWGLVTDWQQIEPSTPHACPGEIVVLAIILQRLLWGWPRRAAGYWMGFAHTLRPIEISTTDFPAVSTPYDRLDFRSESTFVTIKDPKSR